jgi:hypothetical protein
MSCLGARTSVTLFVAVIGLSISGVAQAQPGFQGRTFNGGNIGGGINGNPAMGMAGGINGNPGMGMAGGIHGNPAMGMQGNSMLGGGGGVQEWKCTSCGHTVGTGPTPPSVSKCPKCGVRIGYYQDGSGTHDMPSSSDDSTSGSGAVKILLGFLIAGGVIAGIVVGIVKGTSSGKKKKRRKRIPADDW